VSGGESRDTRWLAETRDDLGQPAGPGGPGGPVGPGKKWSLALGSLVVVFVVLAGYDLISSHGLLTVNPVASARVSPSLSQAAVATRLPTSSATGGASPSGTVSKSLTASPSATSQPAQVLSAVSVAAFGPDGTSDGDNPDLASRVLDGDGVDAWESAWYESAAFGNLQAGTGLLLDMGARVSVSSVQLALAAAVGADVQVRLGDAPYPGDLSTAASAYDVGGTVYLPLPAPVRARYVLIWFTLLPPDSQGTYQVSVYGVTVNGRL
jgi:hypothetical protein